MKPLVTREAFEGVKMLIEKGMKNVEIAKVIPLSATTIGRIRNCDDYDNFYYSRKKAVMPVEAQTSEEPPVTQISVNYQFNRLTELIKEQNELISAALKILQDLLLKWE